MQSLKAKIVQYFALFSFILTIIISIYVLYYVRNTIVSEAEFAIERSAKDAAQIIAARNENQFIYLEGIAKGNRFRFPQSFSKENLERLEEEVLGYAYFTRVGIADLEGNLHMLSENNASVQKIDIKAIKHYTRATDKLFRFGGDEFLLLLNHCHYDNASRIVHLILEALETDQDLQPSFSYGIVQYDWLRHQSPEALIKEADALMYTHKKTRRKAKNLGLVFLFIFPKHGLVA